MSTVRELHREAMALAQRALIEREAGNAAVAEMLSAQALPIELSAARLVEKSVASEPTRSMLYLSAASLAFQAKDNATAQRLVAEGLSGYPPPKVEQDLKDLYEQINLSSHLQVRGVVLTSDQVQLTMIGQEVGSGMILAVPFMSRIKALMTLFSRTTNRLNGYAYDRKPVAIDNRSLLIPLLSAPRAGSFSVTVQFAQNAKLSRSMFVSGADVINSVMDGLKDLETGDSEGLEARIPEESYRVNFQSLAKQFLPDGDQITMVGLTSGTKQISLSKTKQQVLAAIPASSTSADDEGPYSWTGLLDAAIMQQRQIALILDDGEKVRFHVAEGMDDMVREFFNRRVHVTARTNGKRKNLLEIDNAEGESE
jgi:hypothetical protein